MIRGISLQQDENRAVLRVGCQTLIFQTMELAAQALMLYLRDPDVADGAYMLAVDQLRHQRAQDRMNQVQGQPMTEAAPSVTRVEDARPDRTIGEALGITPQRALGHIGLDPHSATLLVEAIGRIERDARQNGYQQGQEAALVQLAAERRMARDARIPPATPSVAGSSSGAGSSPR